MAISPHGKINTDSWWTQTLADSLRAVGSGETGLSSAEAVTRLARYGQNEIRTQPQRALLVQFLMRFRNPLVIILLVASLVSALMGEVTSSLIISVIILMSVVLDFVQEHRAGRAAERLRQSVSLRAQVLRDGSTQTLAASSIVPGDVVLLSAGDLVPADARLLSAKDFFVQQSLLTGESYPVEKLLADLATGADEVQEASNAVFMGTSVISGSARVLVMATGRQTEIGAIADTLARDAPPTAFEIGTRRFGVLIMRLTLLMVLFVLMVNVFLHKPLLDSFLFAIALAVGLTPELLPMIVSVTLSRGAILMARRQVIVKRLSSIQNLGSMDVLCTDKTGTLTEAVICLEKHVDPQGNSSERVLELAYLNSYFETGLKSPLDDAILKHTHIDVSAWQKIDEVPFDFERRRVSVLLDRSNDHKPERHLVVKGAPEDILALCNRCENENGVMERTIDSTLLLQLQAQCHALESEGFRVLGIAWRDMPQDHPHAVVNDETGLVFCGFAAFLDPPKTSATEALAELAASGVTVKIVTGDSELVTQHVCRALGMTIQGVLTGKEIARMDDDALRARVEQINLFCRVNPAQKDRVILAFKARGHVVGYLGDGINDAPPLHSADVGLSVDSAVDVAKEAADMILLEHDLRVLHEGVLVGRQTFGNIMKYIMMGTSSNFGNMFSMAGASLFLPFLPMLPTQILLNNLLYDCSEVPIPLDHVDQEYTRQPHKFDLAFIRNFMIVIGLISSLFDFITFAVLLVILRANESLFQTGWFVESLCTQILVIFVIRTQGNPLRSRAHPALALSSVAIVLLAAWLPSSPLAGWFGFSAPPFYFYVLLVAMTTSYLLLVQWVKVKFYRYAARKQLSAS